MGDSGALLTCIIPTRNDLAHLPGAVDSVLDNSPAAMAVVVDDGSTDGTKGWLSDVCRANPRVLGASLTEHVGVGAARNIGLALVRTPFMSFLDSDDVHLPGFYQDALDLLQRFQQAAAVRGEIQLVDIPGDVSVRSGDPRVDAIAQSVVWNLVIRTAVARAIGGFPVNEFFKGTQYDDYAFCQALQASFDVVLSRRLACRHTVRAGGHTHAFLQRTRVAGAGFEFTSRRPEEQDGSLNAELASYWSGARSGLVEAQGLLRDQGSRIIPDDSRALTPLKVYVVNLRRRPDRKQRMLGLLPKDLDVTFTSDWSGPFDGKDITAAALQGYGLFPWQIESEKRWWCRPLKKGQIGCAISHLRCWEHAWSAGSELNLFLEDDVCFPDGFWAELPRALDELEQFDGQWELAYLGRLRMEYDHALTGRIATPGFSYCSFAYVVRRTGLEKMLAADLGTSIVPVDEFLPAMYMDHPRLDVRSRFPKRLRAYAFFPPLATQLAPVEAGSDTEASDFWDDSEAADLA